MRQDPRQEAPNYTKAALVMCTVNLTWMLGALWAAFGLHAVILAAVGLNCVIAQIGRRRAGG